MSGRAHVNTTAVQVMPVVPVGRHTKAVARWFGGPDHPQLRVRVWEPDAVRGLKLVACWTVTYP